MSGSAWLVTAETKSVSATSVTFSVVSLMIVLLQPVGCYYVRDLIILTYKAQILYLKALLNIFTHSIELHHWNFITRVYSKISVSLNNLKHLEG